MEPEKTRQRTVEEERLTAIASAVSGIAHDVNNSLAAILGFSEMLLMRPETLHDTAKVRRHLQTISTAAKDVAAVIQRMRKFYRKRAPTEKFQPIDIHLLVDQVVSLAEPRCNDPAVQTNKAISVKIQRDEVPTVAGNESELREALTNLMINAIDAMPTGGDLTVRVKAVNEAESRQRSRREGLSLPSVAIEVSDTGIGMTDETRQRFLEPFFSTKGERGTGLGLPMVYGIIQRHGGKVDIRSEVGKGTTVSISLPAMMDQTLKVTKQELGSSSGPLAILVVDDDPRICEMLLEYLETDGHVVEVASSGAEALKKFYAGWFDVVVTDRAMPGMNGDELAEAIKRRAPSKPVILLTGVGHVMKDLSEKPPGVDYIVGKPVTPKQLRSALAKVTSHATPGHY